MPRGKKPNPDNYCINCRCRPASINYKTCEFCRTKNSKYKKTPEHRRKLAQKRKDLLAQGICCKCHKNPVIVDRTYCEKCKEQWKLYSTVSGNKKQRYGYIVKWNYSKRKLALEAYGGKCACCGESNYMFLDFDHINNDGGVWRKANKTRGTGGDLVRWVIKNKFPDTIQILCANCNQGKNRNMGVCPHKDPTYKFRHYGLTMED